MVEVTQEAAERERSRNRVEEWARRKRCSKCNAYMVETEYRSSVVRHCPHWCMSMQISPREAG